MHPVLPLPEGGVEDKRGKRDSYYCKKAPYMETKETGKENQEKVPTSIPAFTPRMGREGNLKGAGYSSGGKATERVEILHSTNRKRKQKTFNNKLFKLKYPYD